MKIRREEIWIIEQFQKLYTTSSLENILKCESPDFIASLSGIKTGIEITQVFQDSNNGQHSKLQQYSSDSASITNQIIKELQPLFNFHFSIGIVISEKYPIKKSNRKQIIKNIKDRCIPALSNLQDRQIIDLDYYDGLPQEVEKIFIDRFDNMDFSFDSRPEGGIVKNLFLDHIQPILSQKEQKINKYLTCDQYWLIIAEGKYYAGSFSKIMIETPINSSFDKVFLIRTNKNELIELK
ncbi:MAG: hypothetical protein IPH88_02070 [Bacteroidales bacterium]|nr:hypothetical protein [Bacteroidales bacterium]